MTDTIPGIHMDSSIEIGVSPAQAFEFWKSMENFPKFMTHVKHVEAVSDICYEWTVDAALGATVKWQANVTEVVDNKRIAWRTAEDAQVPNTGVVEFEDNGEGGTNLHVQLKYDPPAGKLGHAIATLFGRNPGQQMDDDLVRCKEILERGATEQGVTRSEVQTAETHKPG